MSADPLDGGAAAEIAAAARAEWRAEEDEWTHAAFERWQHDRNTLDVVRDVMHRGDVVAVEFSQVTYRGDVRAVGDDFFSIDASGARVDIRVARGCALVFRVVERAHAGGTRGADVTTFRARLLDLEAGMVDVEVGTTSGATAARGRVRVGRDHMIVHEQAGHDVVVPFDAVGWLRTGSEPD